MSDAELARRIVAVRGMIDDTVANEVIAKLLFLEHTDKTAPAWLELDSPGGQVSSALAIRDTMDGVAMPVHTRARRAEGMAAVLLAHGVRGQRFASAHARVAFTPIAIRADADIAPTIDTAADIARTREIVVAMLAADTGQDAGTIRTDLAKSRSFDAAEACTYGLIDHVV